MKVEIQKISIPKILEEEKTPLVNQLLEIIQQQSEQIQQQAQQIQQQAQQIQQQAQKIQILKDEISKLKKLNSKPKIKPSNLDKNTDTDEEKINKKKKKNSSKRSKTKEIEIHETVVIQPDEIPEGSKFKGYSDFIVQDIQIINHNVCYRRAQWETPSGEYVSGNLPNNVSSHFGNNLISFILYQKLDLHYQNILMWMIQEQDIAGKMDIVHTLAMNTLHGLKAQKLRAELIFLSFCKEKMMTLLLMTIL